MNPAAVAVNDQFQDGIYYRSKETPAPFYRLLLLNVAPGAPANEARVALAELWVMLQQLRQGVVQDLQATRPTDPPFVAVAGNDLTVLIGYGARLFDAAAHDPPLTTARRPRALHRLAPPVVGVAAPRPFPKLHWDSSLLVNPADADIALQFIGDTELLVNRAIVEVRKRIRQVPLQWVTFYSGFQREDRRSWIDFHDGINTMSADERRLAMEIAASAQFPWLAGGTYMNFMRIAIDLDLWQSLRREQQEVLVGRDKLTGCPITRFEVDAAGNLVPRLIEQCPFTREVPNNPPLSYLDPGRPAETRALTAHIFRSNLNRGSASQPANNRIYRQGYEFLEALPVDAGDIRLGLNFVSFQRDTEFVENILTTERWLQDVNFGGRANAAPPDPQAIALMRLMAAAYFAVPPKADPFPGAALFDA